MRLFAVLLTAAALAGCATAPGAAPGQSAAMDTDHNSATSGFGPGPQDFNTNGGAFGPDQLDHAGNR